MNIFKRTIVLTILTSLIFSCAKYKQEKVTIKSTTVKQTQARVIQNKATIIDVRTPEEYKASHIDGAININISSDSFEKEIAKLDRDEVYVLHCGTNTTHGRTDQAITMMDKLGFDEIYSMDGGIVEWEKQNLPVVKMDAKPEPKHNH